LDSAKKRVLLLGGTGAMGVYLAPELLRLGYEVYITSRSARTAAERGIHYIKGNAKDLAFLDELLESKYDAIVDFMVYHTDEFAERYERLLANTEHYLFLSSYRVYGDNGRKPITEEAPRLLDSVKDEKYLATDEYGLTKARQENILAGAAKKNWTVLRPAITYSKDRFQLGTMEANEFLYRALRGKPIIFPRQMLGKQATMSWAGDVAKLIAKLTLNPNAMGEFFTVSTAEHHTWKEIVAYYKELLGVRVKIVDLDTYRRVIGRPWQIKYDRMLNRIIDNSKALAAAGMRQEDFMPLREGLRIELANFSKAPRYAAINKEREKKLDKITFAYFANLRLVLYNIAKKLYRMKKKNVPTKEIVKKVVRSKQFNKLVRPILLPFQIKSHLFSRIFYDGAIVTLTGNYNYGSVMQRWALQKTLKSCGYKFKLMDFKFMLAMSKKTGDRANVAKFVNKHLDKETFNPHFSKFYKAYIVGSDQVWRDFFNNDWNKFGRFFLNFVKGKSVKRIGYAISFGTDTLAGANIDAAKEKKIRPLVKKFNSISVREQSGTSLVKQLGGSAVRVLDPTLLLDAKKYSALVDNSKFSKKRTAPLFFYILDTNKYKEKIIDYYSETMQLDKDGIFPNNGKPLPPPEIWLKGFRDSRLVITDSFHGMVFSIINHTPFFVFANKARGIARMTELLDMLGIQNRIIVEGADVATLSENLSIDWDEVDKKLAEYRAESIQWLQKSLGV
jgi:nucleoside-diphosphate-sugar epimerase